MVETMAQLCSPTGVVASTWNSLEITKLAISVLTPLLLLALGLLVNRATRRLEDAQWSNRKLIEKRIEVYEHMAPLINDLYCFFRFVGTFREITPPRAVQIKREIDKLFHVNRFLFEARFSEEYERFIDLCFMTWTGPAQSAKVRALMEWQRQERAEDWKPEWAECFAPEGQATNLRVLTGSYLDLMDVFAAQLGVTSQPEGRAAPKRRRLRRGGSLLQRRNRAQAAPSDQARAA